MGRISIIEQILKIKMKIAIFGAVTISAFQPGGDMDRTTYDCPQYNSTGYCELAPDWPVYIPSYESCRNFVQCSEYGGQYICSCPEGLQYNHRDGVCEWPNARECCERSEDEGGLAHRPCETYATCVSNSDVGYCDRYDFDDEDDRFMGFLEDKDSCEDTDDFWGMGICCYDEDTGDLLGPCPLPEVTTGFGERVDAFFSSRMWHRAGRPATGHST